MSRPDPDDWHEPESDWEEPISARWPLSCEGLYPRERWMWFEQLWSDVCALRIRYRLALRTGWWEDQVQVEALAALSAWVERYDSGEWDDPPGKLALLFDLERIALLLRAGGEPFHPSVLRPSLGSGLVSTQPRPRNLATLVETLLWASPVRLTVSVIELRPFMNRSRRTRNSLAVRWSSEPPIPW